MSSPFRESSILLIIWLTIWLVSSAGDSPNGELAIVQSGFVHHFISHWNLLHYRLLDIIMRICCMYVKFYRLHFDSAHVTFAFCWPMVLSLVNRFKSLHIVLVPWPNLLWCCELIHIGAATQFTLVPWLLTWSYFHSALVPQMFHWFQ